MYSILYVCIYYKDISEEWLNVRIFKIYIFLCHPCIMDIILYLQVCDRTRRTLTPSPYIKGWFLSTQILTLSLILLSSFPTLLSSTFKSYLLLICHFVSEKNYNQNGAQKPRTRTGNFGGRFFFEVFKTLIAKFNFHQFFFIFC